jgi:hypothetical protein
MHCTANKKDGKKCSRQCKPGDKYCWQHQQKKSTKNGNNIQEKYCRCILDVKQKSPRVNPYAVCTSKVGRTSKSCKAYGH